ncbi:hypothetical protein PYCC9005_004759 [Savitreella phatthalungensis]
MIMMLRGHLTHPRGFYTFRSLPRRCTPLLSRSLATQTETKPTPIPDPSTSPSPPTDQPKRLPKWAQKYADRFKNHPTSHITSFLILHEITAVLPLPLLFWLFHSFDWTPESLVTSSEYVEKGAKLAAKQLERWGLRYTGPDETRYVFEGAAAYAVVKALMPLRIALSFALTPAFARRVVVPVGNIFRRNKRQQQNSQPGQNI